MSIDIPYKATELLITTLGWIGEIISIQPLSFKSEQGVNIKRIDDGAIFSIGPNDISRRACEEDLIKYFQA